MTVKDGGSMPRRNISSTNGVEVRKCVMLSKVTFQEVLLMSVGAFSDRIGLPPAVTGWAASCDGGP